MTILVRPASVDDVPIIAALGRQLNIHQGDPVEHFSNETIYRDGFRFNPEFRVLLAEWKGEPSGYALFHPCYETGWAARGFYLADLFVLERARGRGLGRALVAAVAATANREGRTFLWFATKDWNETAQRIYRALGASAEPIVAHAITHDRFMALAAEGDVGES